MSYTTKIEHRGQRFILNDLCATRKKMCYGRLKRKDTFSDNTSRIARSRVKSAYLIDNVNNHNEIQANLLKFDCNNLRLEINQIKDKLMDLSRPFVEQSILYKDQLNIYERENKKDNVSLESQINMYDGSNYGSTMSSISTNLSTSTYESTEPMNIQGIVEELRNTGETLQRVIKDRDNLRTEVKRLNKQLHKADENCCRELQCLRKQSNGVDDTIKNLIKTPSKDAELIRNEQNSMIFQLESLKAKHKHCLCEIEELSDKLKNTYASTSIVSTSNEYLSKVQENKNLKCCIEEQSLFLEKSKSEMDSYESQYEKKSKTIKDKQRCCNVNSRIIYREKKSTACQCVSSKGQNEFMDRGTDVQTSQVTKSTQRSIHKKDQTQQADDFSLLNLILHKMCSKHKREIEQAKTIEGKINALINIPKQSEETPFDDIQSVLQETNSAIETIINKIKNENKQYIVNKIDEPLQLIN